MTSIREAIEASRSSERADRWEYHRRGALMDLDREGFSTLAEASIGLCATHANMEASMRYRAWVAESLVWTIDRIRENRHAEALRGYLQVIEYSARVHGSYTPAWLMDAKGALRSHFENVLAKKEKVAA